MFFSRSDFNIPSQLSILYSVLYDNIWFEPDCTLCLNAKIMFKKYSRRILLNTYLRNKSSLHFGIIFSSPTWNFLVDFALEWELWTAISIRACVFIFFSEKVSSCETIHCNSVVNSFNDFENNLTKKLQFGQKTK